jgi:hypothetical protein
VHCFVVWVALANLGAGAVVVALFFFVQRLASVDCDSIWHGLIPASASAGRSHFLSFIKLFGLEVLSSKEGLEKLAVSLELTMRRATGV